MYVVMDRIAVVGNSGSGKSTLARRVAGAIDAPHVELDAIYHQPGWQPLPEEEFRDRVRAAAAGERWVIDGNYSVVRDLVWARADTVLWLDLPRATVMRQLVSRTLRRGLLRMELWNGNRETLRNFIRRDPQESIIMWAWTRHHLYRERYEALAAAPEWAHLRFVRLTSPRDAATLVARLQA